MISKKITSSVITATLAVGVLSGAYMAIAKSQDIRKAETIVLEDLNVNRLSQDKSPLFKEVYSMDNVIGWTANDTLLFVKDTIKSFEGEKAINTIILEERMEDGETYQVHEIKFIMDMYNENLISDYEVLDPNFIDNVKYMVLISPDKEKVLISLEIINAHQVSEDGYRITNQGYSALCDLKTGKITFIEDNGRFVKWSYDSNNVFGINYVACYYNYMPLPYDQHFFPSYTYRNVSYNINDKKVSIVTEDNPLYESLIINKDIFDNILNNSKLEQKKRFLLGYTATEKVLQPELKIKKLPFNNNPYNLNYIINISEEGDYIFMGTDNLSTNTHGFPAIYTGTMGEDQKEKIFEAFFSSTYKSVVTASNILYLGHPLASFQSPSAIGILSLNMYNMESDKNFMIYEGQVESFAYCPQTNAIAIYDDVKQEILIGKLINDKIINLKSYHKINNRVIEMYFNKDGSKLYFKGSSNDVNGLIYVKDEK